jgi:thiamine-monophosphate kinase
MVAEPDPREGLRLADLGELGLLRRIVPALAASAAVGLRLGAGDDAAIWRPPPGSDVVATTDTLVEGVHFFPPATAADAADLGWKLLAISLSDLAAMGAEPGPAFLALALPAGWPVALLDGLYAGLAECAGAFGASLAGGNLSAAAQPVLTSTCLGTVPPDQALRRTGALPGWELATTGRLGGAAAALRELAEPREAPPASGPETAPAWRLRLARPTPRLTAGRALLEAGISVALDISDGLYLDAARLLGVAGDEAATGLVIDVDALPLEPGIAERWPQEMAALAGGGEDYELLFAAPPEAIARAVEALEALGVGATVVGRFDGGRGVRLRAGGVEVAAPASGHEHFHGLAR